MDRGCDKARLLRRAISVFWSLALQVLPIARQSRPWPCRPGL